MSRKNLDGWKKGDTCILPNGKPGEVVDALKRSVCVRYLMDIQVGRTTYHNAGYNESWFDNDQIKPRTGIGDDEGTP